MQCIILAAGKGTRMGDLTLTTPKPLLMIGNTPLLVHKLRTLPESIDEVVFVVGYLEEQMKEFFGTEFEGRSIRYVTQKVLDGTGGALLAAKDVVEKEFLVLMGDDLYSKSDLERLMKTSRGLLVKKVPSIQGMADVQMDSSGNLTAIIEAVQEDRPGFVNAAAYKMDTTFFEITPVPKAPGSEEIGLPQTIVAAIDTYPYEIIEATNWHPCTTPEDLQISEEELKKFYN
jgi:bifunctional UDP-N-acetylglucosamine pyrophosphorylase/glucosamine-1-phosphate N-acetyltransferase